MPPFCHLTLLPTFARIKVYNIMELNIQKLLRNKPDALDQIQSMGIQVKNHPQFTDLKQFAYDILESHAIKDHPVVCESRGLLLNSADNWNVVAYPFNRFFNWGEPGAVDIDWSTARVQEKLDGSLIVMYYWAGTWHVNTRKTPGAGSSVGDWGISFADLFWRCWNQQYGDTGFAHLTPGFTYCWELTSPLNRVVTHNRDERITLLAVRDSQGQEQDVQQYQNAFDVVRHFEFGSAEAAAQAAEMLDPMEQEGFVVVDAEFRRVKIKSSHYVAIHHTVTSLNTRSIVKLIQRGEADEVMAYFPEILTEFNRIAEHISAEASEIDRWFSFLQPWAQQVILNGDRVAESTSRKPFSAAVTQHVPARYHAPMFALVKQQTGSGREWILEQDTESILRWMNFRSLKDFQKDAE